MTDQEVITLEICGEYFQFQTDKGIFSYFQYYYPHFFPQLTPRTLFLKQAANLWQIKALLQPQLVVHSGQQKAPWQLIDTLPIPVCQTRRATRSSFRQPAADYGYCAAKREYYSGVKLGLRVTPIGMIVNYPLLPARPHDVQFLETWVAGSQGIVIGDKGFLAEPKQPQLFLHGVQIITPTRRHRKTFNGWNST